MSVQIDALATVAYVDGVYRCHNSKTRRATVDFFCGANDEVIPECCLHPGMESLLLYLTATGRVSIVTIS